MTEEHGTYDAHHADPDRHDVGLGRVGDIVQRLIDERGWPLSVGVTRVNGNRPDGNADPSHGDA